MNLSQATINYSYRKKQHPPSPDGSATSIASSASTLSTCTREKIILRRFTGSWFTDPKSQRVVVLVDNKGDYNEKNRSYQQQRGEQHPIAQTAKVSDMLSTSCDSCASSFCSCSIVSSNSTSSSSDVSSRSSNPAEEHLRNVFADSTPEQRKRFVRCHMNLSGYPVGCEQYQQDLKRTQTLLGNYLAFRKQYNFDLLNNDYDVDVQSDCSRSFEEMDKTDWEWAWKIAWETYRERPAEEYFPEEQEEEEEQQSKSQRTQYINEGYMVPQYVFSVPNNNSRNVLVNEETSKTHKNKHFFVLTCVPGLIDLKNVPNVELHGLAVALYMERKLQKYQRTVLCNDHDTFQTNFLIDVRSGKGWPNETPMKLFPLIKFVTKIMTSLFGDRLNKLISAPVPFVMTAIYNMVSTYYFQGYLASKAILISGSNSDSKGLQNKLVDGGHVCSETFLQIEQRRHQSMKGGKKRKQ